MKWSSAVSERTSLSEAVEECVLKVREDLGGDRPNQDTDLFRESVGPLPLSGFFCNEEIGQVASRGAVLLQASDQGVLAEILLVGEVGVGVDARRVVADEALEALGRGVRFRPRSQAPLSEQGGPVSGLPEQVSQGDLSRREPDARHRGAGEVAAREQGRARRDPDGGVGIEVGEAHPALGQAVQVRGDQVGGAVAAKVPAAQVVGQDEEDMGARAQVRPT